ncbi:MAG: TetR/AcrR family transcriptional regulator [Mariprofundales bacterium]
MNAEATRQKILNIAAEEIHLHGFQACNTSTIIEKVGISKGALYHHFSSKLKLGYAVVDEVFTPKFIGMWRPVIESDDPVNDMIRFFHEALTWNNSDNISKGCPLNNLAQEMSPIDEGFRLRIASVMTRWRDGIAAALRRGQKNGLLDQGINCDRTATLLIASIEGTHGLAKSSQSVETFSQCVHGIIDYLERL